MRIGRWIAIGLGVLAACLVLAVALVFLLAQSDGGRDRIARGLEALLSTPGSQEIAIGRLEGRFPDAMTVASLEVRDPEGPWLRARALALSWQPLELLSGTLRIDGLTLEELAIERAPSAAPSEAEDPAAFEVPRLPVEIALEHLAVEKLVLGEAVLGAPAELGLRAQASTRDANDLLALLHVERRDGVAGRVRAELRYQLAERRLALDLAASEPAGGLIARLLDLPELPALEASVKGDGPLDGWQGGLEVGLDGLAQVTAELRLADRGDLRFELSGEAATETRSEALPWPLIAPRTRFALEGAWRDMGTLSLDRAELDSDTVVVSLSGDFDTGTGRLTARLAGSLDGSRLVPQLLEGAESGRLSFEAEASGSLDKAEIGLRLATDSLTLPDAAARGLTLDGQASGPLLQPVLRAEARAEAVTTPEVAAGGVTARVEFRPDAPLDRGPLGGRFEAAGAAAKLQLPSAPELQEIAGGGLDWKLAGRLDGGTQTLWAERVEVATAQATVSGKGKLGLSDDTAEAELDLDWPDIAPLGRLADLGLQGRARLTTVLAAQDLNSGMTARLSGELRDLAVDEPFAQALAGDGLTVNAEVAVDFAGRLAVEALAVETSHAALTGSVELSEGFETLAADYALSVPTLAVLGAPAGLQLAGAARLDGTAKGKVADPGLKGRLELAKPSVDGQGLERLRLDYTAEQLAGEPRGQVQAVASTPIGEVTARTGFRLDQDALHLSGLAVEAGATRATGEAKVPLNGAPLDAELEIAAPDLAPWLELGALRGTGSLEARLRLFAAGARQSATLDATVLSLALVPEDLSAGRLDAHLEATDLLGRPAVAGRIAAIDLSQGEMALESLTLEGDGGPGGGELRLAASGTWIEPLELDGAARITRAGEALQIELARLEGRTLGQDLRLARPARIELAPGAASVADLDLAFGPARLQGAARQSAKALAADIRLNDLPVTALEPLWSSGATAGRISGMVSLAGTPRAPSGRLSLTVAALEAGLAAEEGPPMNLDLSGDWESGRLKLAGGLAGLGKEDAAFAAELPLRLDPVSLAPQVPAADPISGSLSWQGRLGEVWPLVPVTGHNLDGDGTVELALAGTVAQPRVTGRLAVAEGSYESFETGTLLRGLELAVDLDGDRVVVSRLEAGDGGEGRMSMTGGGRLDPEAGFPFAVDGELTEFTLVRRDEVTGKAEGKVSLEGTLQAAALTGRFETRGVEIRIPDRLPPQVVELEVVEAGRKLALASPAQAEQPETAMKLDLDLLVEMPDRVFVRGRGLDSEWAGRLEARGTADAPEITGRLELVRGRLSLLGRDFNLERGTIDFPGGAEINPLIDVEAKGSSKDAEVTFRVTGSATNPKIALSSVPPLPQDEIVARLLFGKATTQLSAIEAAQLAAAVADLTGGGGATNIFDMARGALGVDVLRVESAGNGDAVAPALSVGKYVTDNVYVGVKRGAAAESGSMEVEVELTPNISVESEVGETGQSNVGIKFKWDY